MNLLENQLRSWQPRRPSPRINRKLFGAASPGETAGLSLRWLAPAVACLFLALTIVNQEPGLSSSSRHQPLMGLVSSNLSCTNILPENHPAGRNGISPPSFEWTNRSGFTSSISPFSPGRMN
jgi:hypothetical protein